MAQAFAILRAQLLLFRDARRHCFAEHFETLAREVRATTLSDVARPIADAAVVVDYLVHVTGAHPTDCLYDCCRGRIVLEHARLEPAGNERARLARLWVRRGVSRNRCRRHPVQLRFRRQLLQLRRDIGEELRINRHR